GRDDLAILHDRHRSRPGELAREPLAREAAFLETPFTTSRGSPDPRPFRRRSRLSLFDAFRYDGKRVVVVGGATGMGAAAALLAQDAGADVVVMDFAEVTRPGVKAIRVNLAERESIEAAVDACGGPVHALFSCAGVADGTPGIERINFVGHRHLIDRMVSREMLRRGSAICMGSSLGGIGWGQSFARLSKLLDIPDFAAATQWFSKHGRPSYPTPQLPV